VHKQEVIDLIGKNSFFADFTEAEKAVIAETGDRILQFDEGCYIIRQGTVGEALYVLLEGEVAIIKNEAPHAELNHLQAGALFGEIPLITGLPRSTNVVSKTRATVLKMDGAMLENLDRNLFNKFNFQLLKMLIQRLDTMNRGMADFKSKLEGFVDAYEFIRKEVNNNPSTRENVKMVQDLWSNYFRILRR